MKTLLTILLVFCIASTVSSSVFAQGKPIQLALFNPIQIVPENEAVSGFRFSLIYGQNTSMSGFDLGLVTKTTGNFTGVQWGFVGMVDQNFEGWQYNLASITDGNFTGLQMGFYSSANYVNGLQFSLINSAG